MIVQKRKELLIGTSDGSIDFTLQDNSVLFDQLGSS